MERYAEDYKDDAAMPPLIGYETRHGIVLIDGNNRHAGALLAGGLGVGALMGGVSAAVPSAGVGIGETAATTGLSGVGGGGMTFGNALLKGFGKVIGGPGGALSAGLNVLGAGLSSNAA